MSTDTGIGAVKLPNDPEVRGKRDELVRARDENGRWQYRLPGGEA